MESSLRNSDLPVLLVYDLDDAWDPVDVEVALEETRRFTAALRRHGHSVVPVPLRSADVAAHLEPYDPSRHVVFNWCEGLPGLDHSDDAAARALEDLNYTYTGATGEVLALSRDKCRTKGLLRTLGLPTPDWCVVPPGGATDWSTFPAIVKPACAHSSLGMTSRSVVLTPAELAAQVDSIHRQFGQAALVEEFIDGREFHVTLWGNGSVEMLPPAEMDFSACADVRDRICCFDSKFVLDSESCRRIGSLIPAPLSDDQLLVLRETCTAAYRALGCRDYARLDVRLRDGVFQILDINPNADVSPGTSLTCAAKVAGFPYGALGSRIVRLAAHRHPVLGGR